MPVRDATPDDFLALHILYKSLLEFEQQYIESTVTSEYADSLEGIDFINQMCHSKTGRLAIVFEEDGIIKGFASLRDVPEIEYANREIGKQADIETLCVGNEWRNEGIGRLIILECLNIAKNNNYRNVKVSALAKNARARHVYKEMGFQEMEITYEMKV